jgi:hypothetical protein
MSKLREFVNKGVRLIVADVPGTGQAPATGGKDIPPEAFAEPAAPAAPSSLPADVADFSPVYDEAGIVLPAHGYGVDKVAEMLESKRLKPLAREVKATAVLAAVEAAGAPIRDVIQDAVARDRALDAFEAGKAAELKQLRAAADARVQAIKDEIDEFLRQKNAEIEELKKTAEAAGQAFLHLQSRKQREEERLFDAVAHFLEGGDNPISAGAQPSGGASLAPPDKP